MEAKYNAAIKAGVIGGILLAAYAVIMFVINLITWNAWVPGLDFLQSGCGCLLWPVVIVLSAGTGALAVKYAASLLTKLQDALMVSALAGAVAGLIYAVITIVIAVITPVLTSIYTDVGLSGLGGSAFAGICGIICLPVYIVIVAIIAAIGGAIYGALQLKLS